MNKLMEKHNAKLREKGIKCQAVLPYRSGSNPLNDYICPEGHKFVADRARVVAGKTTCPECNPGVGKLLSHEGYEKRLLEVDAYFVPLEQYKGATTKILHSCLFGHEHMIDPRRVWEKKQGCPHCSGRFKKTTESYGLELKEKGIKYIPVEEYVNIMTKINHKCYVCKHIWPVKPHDILNNSGCPMCAKSGFNNNKPAILYYVRIWDDKHTYYKIGITNKTIKERLKNTKKKYKVLMQKEYETGFEAKAAERMILEEYGDLKIYTPQFLPMGGYTELFKEDVLLLDDKNDI